jgi:hypothetical protein
MPPTTRRSGSPPGQPRSAHRWPIRLAVAGAALALLAGLMQEDESPVWGSHGRWRPTAANTLFATADGCALCHNAATRSQALRNAAGEDISPYTTWQSTMMASSFIDPFWRAQVAREMAASDGREQAVVDLCTRCHEPMLHHSQVRLGDPISSPFAVADNALARDGVSCTVCHQVTAEGLGSEARFEGHIAVQPDRLIYGPYADPQARPMYMHTRFTATHGAHIQDASHCGTCHTLRTGPNEHLFAEQTVYLEWSNSAFAGEQETPATTCQSCHMPSQGSTRIAHNPGGRDFPFLSERPEVRAHEFVGGNTFMLDLIDQHADSLRPSSSGETRDETHEAARAQLKHATATIEITGVEAGGSELSFTVTVRNLTGHKFPAGFPSRRAWLHVQVLEADEVIFESGAMDEAGRIVGLPDGTQPHHAVITQPTQVQIYELVAADESGEATTLLTRMHDPAKDNRLLPVGWRADGPHAETTQPIGIGDDPDFQGGSDATQFRLALPPTIALDDITIGARLLYQTVPPTWVDPLRAVDAEAARQFVAMVDSTPADSRAEVITWSERQLAD